jgi:MFS family permease
MMSPVTFEAVNQDEILTVEENPPPDSRMGRMFSALHYREFRLLWAGALISTTGTWMQTVAQAWLVLSLTGSAFLLGVDGFLATLPMILFSLLGGVIADRIDRRKILLMSQYLQMTFAFVLALLVYFKKVEVWQVFVLSFLTGSAQSFGGPAYQALLPILVRRREDVPNAVAMNSIQFNLARVIGPVMAGLALAAVGAAGCFALNGLSFIAVIITLWMIRTPFIPAPSAGRSVLMDMGEGLRFMKQTHSLVQLSLFGFLGAFFGVPLVTLLPVVAKETFHFGATGYSWILTAYGVGSVLGALAIAGSGHIARKGKLAIGLLVGFSIFLIVFAFSHVLWLSILAILVAGGTLMGVFAMVMSLVQLATSEEMRGRVMSIFMLAFRGGMPLGNLTTGFFAERFSVAWALGMNGVCMLVVGGIFLFAPVAMKEL